MDEDSNNIDKREESEVEEDRLADKTSDAPESAVVMDENKDEAWFLRTRNIIYYILGVIEVLLAFRLIFRSLGANAMNGMVALIYSLTKVLTSPFSGIFNAINPTGVGQYVIEPSTVIAMVVYALLAYGLVKLVKVTAVSV